MAHTIPMANITRREEVSPTRRTTRSHTVPVQFALGTYLVFDIGMGFGFLKATDIWLHNVWGAFFLIAAVACSVLIYGGSNRWLEPAGALTTTALAARPVGILYEALVGHADRTPPRIWITVVLYVGFAVVTACFFVVIARLREE